MLFQSTHPHGVRLTNSNLPVGRLSVSIHAPTRGATPDRGAVPCGRCVFQSTHPHGVRRTVTSGPRCTQGFNPRTHTGCDDFYFPEFAHLGVSIHAPTRGATYLNDNYEYGVYGFQSTHPHGVRHTLKRKIMSFIQFQSTHPHGVRLSLISPPNDKINVSIHAPTRGATLPPVLNDALDKFQSTHPHGVRLTNSNLPVGRLSVSIHAPTRGATPRIRTL